MANAFDQYRMMRMHHLIFGYRGTITNDLITSILQLSDSKLKELKTPFRNKKSIINILIECLQNVLYHSETFRDGIFSGHHCLFLLGKREDGYFIQIGNFVDPGQKAELKSRIDYLNTLDSGEVHKMYLQVLDNGSISEKGGAGLGILRVLKDSGNPIAYDFFPAEEGRTFFCMEIQIYEEK
jgi:hypothetical protein